MANSKIICPFVRVSDEVSYPVSAVPDNYRHGLTIVYTQASTNYPKNYGVVLTFKASTARVVQMSFNQTGSSVAVRGALDGTTWSTWAVYSPTQ